MLRVREIHSWQNVHDLARLASMGAFVMPDEGAVEVSPAAGLTRQVRRLLEATPGADRFLPDWPDLTERRETRPQFLPVVTWLPALAATSSPAITPLVEMIADAADQLEWRQTYSAADFGAAFLDRYGWTELVGTRGPVPSDSVACGFLLLGPATYYPPHAHEAEELYLPLAGLGAWACGDGDLEDREIGRSILIRPWEPHAIKTGPEPLLALYVWRGGDLAARSRIIPEGG